MAKWAGLVSIIVFCVLGYNSGLLFTDLLYMVAKQSQRSYDSGLIISFSSYPCARRAKVIKFWKCRSRGRFHLQNLRKGNDTDPKIGKLFYVPINRGNFEKLLRVPLNHCYLKKLKISKLMFIKS